MPLMSRRQYAEHRKQKGWSGTSHVAVGKAVKTGRIRETKDGKIDSDEADALWASNTDEGKVTNDGMGNVSGASAGAAPGAVTNSPFQRARTAKEAANAQLAMLKLDKARGNVVELAVIQAAAESVVNATRTKLLALPAKVRRQLPHVARKDVDVIEALLHEALNELAAGLQQAVTNVQPAKSEAGQ